MPIKGNTGRVSEAVCSAQDQTGSALAWKIEPKPCRVASTGISIVKGRKKALGAEIDPSKKPASQPETTVSSRNSQNKNTQVRGCRRKPQLGQ